MSCNWCGNDNCNGGCQRINVTLVIPSPLAPWQRPPLSPIQETITLDNQTISLSCQVTNLVQATAKDPVAAYVAALPNGQWVGQTKTIIIPASALATTQPWSVTGTFAGFTSLNFTAIGNSAVLQYTDGGWIFLAGNAEQIA